MKRSVMPVIYLLLVTGCMGTVRPDLEPQFESSREYFENHTFTALVDFYVHGNYYIDENGKPIEGKDQSTRIGSKGLMTKDFAVAKGAKGHIFSIGLNDERDMGIGVSESAGLAGAWNPGNIYVHFSRPVTREDVTPAGIARILSSVLVFDDFKPGSELDDMLEDLDTSKSK
ncbi:MAG TPA: hypothetical protein ENJ87_01095 [Gammaproteobacteria bacterium]|nr:hypothetical protein [Gammaproteobacteria bacterium]